MAMGELTHRPHKPFPHSVSPHWAHGPPVALDWIHYEQREPKAKINQTTGQEYSKTKATNNANGSAERKHEQSHFESGRVKSDNSK